MRTKTSLTLEDANAIAAACKRAAYDLSRAVSVAIVDDSGALLHFERMEGARAYTIELAMAKARAAAAVGLPTRVIAAHSKTDVLPGGAPVLHENACAGAIGVSGATAEQDEAIAAAGASTLR